MRSVLLISEGDGQLTASIENAEPPLLPNYEQHIGMGYSSLDLPPLGDGVLYGDTLARGLYKHPAIADLLRRAFDANNAQPHTLALRVRASDGRQIHWEALRDTNGFVALSPRCHIGRVTQRLSGTPTAARTFEPPLKILAYISGAGLDMRTEWDAISSAIDDANRAGLPVQATIHLGPEGLLQDARNECASGKHPSIRVEPMPAASFLLEQQIERERPHVLHFFCHGRGGMGASFLELATAQDHALGQQGGVVLGTDLLARLVALRDTWLVVLNCCGGAETVEDIESMAERLVSQTGTRAIGMLKPVLSGEASLFCQALYPELFQLLDGVLRMQPGTRPQYLDLTVALSRPRRALSDLYKNKLPPDARWTLPVLYQDMQPLEIVREARPAGNGGAAPGSEEWRVLRAKAEVVAGMLAALPPETPELVRERMLAVLDDAPVVPRELRPDRNGRFNAAETAGGG